MDEENAHILSLKTVEITFPLDFLVTATSLVHYDNETSLNWDVKDAGGGEQTLNSIQSCRSSKSLILQFECLRFSVQNERHVCNIGQPILRESASTSSTWKTAVGDGQSCWEFGDTDKMSQTDPAFSQPMPKLNISDSTLADSKPQGVVRKRKVGRPRKIQVVEKTGPSTSNPSNKKLPNNCNHHQPSPSSGTVSVEKQPTCSENALRSSELEKPMVRNEESDNSSHVETQSIEISHVPVSVENERTHTDSKKGMVKSDVSDTVSGVETRPVEKKRYSLRGVKLNSDIMGAVKGIDSTDKENEDDEDDTVNEMSDDSLQSGVSQKRKKVISEKYCASSSTYSKLNVDWIPKSERRPRRIGSIECKMCSKKLCDYTGVYDHVSKKHCKRKGVAEYLKELESLKVEKCKTCGVTFPDRKKLMIHEDREHSKSGRVLCNKCDTSFKNVHTLKTHIRAMHLNHRSVNLCHLCSASFKSSSTLKQHIDQVHLGNKYFQCEICSKKFYNGSQLRRHSRIHNLPESQKHECPTCEKRFIFAHNLKKHIEVVHSTHKESFHCPYCAKGFGQKVGMISHIQLVHFNIFPYTCKECKASFPRAIMLIDHMKSHHKILNFQITDKPAKHGIYHKTKEDMFYCSYCKDAFLHKTRLIEHMHTDHSDAFPAKCESCNQGFLERSFLAVHQMRAHGILSGSTDYLQHEEVDKENNSKRHSILQLITTKGGHSNRTVQYGMQNSADKENATEEELAATVVVQPTPCEEELPQQDAAGSSLLIEVATSGGGTSRYMIETPELLNEGGSWTMAQDIANLLLAAEQSIQEVNEVSEIGEGTTEISLVINGTEPAANNTTYTIQTDAEPVEEETTIVDSEDIEQNEIIEMEHAETGDQEPNNLQVHVEGSGGEIQVITLPSGDGTAVLTGGDLDLLQLAAMETVNISEEQDEDTITIVEAADDTIEEYEIIQ